MKRRNQQGFTLIELMIVIAIIAILMAYALPAYRDYTVRAKLGEGNAMAAGYKMAVNEAYVRNGILTGLTNDVFGIGQVDQAGQCVDTLTVTDGAIAVAFDCVTGSQGTADADVDAGTITWTPAVSADGTLQWTCTSTVNSPGQDPC